ncbi:MAG: FAD-binding protein [Desulfuromonadaceae bacterium]|nr:FAD-binding protein [Desulfuromonadaceae bacterium]
MKQHEERGSAAELLELLKGEFAPRQLLSTPAELENYDRDASELRIQPQVVVKARGREDVQKLMRLANRHRFPVIPRGAGTGLAGGCLAPHGGVILALAEMNRILSIDEKNLIAEVEPGVITQHLKDAARLKGLYYPPDPAGLDQSTIGGNAATNAGGPACVKYGTTRDYILALEVVLPDGEVIRTGVQTRKGVVGYDLTHLMVGSEGTLGIITSLTLKLIPHPAAIAGMAVIFPDMGGATRAVSEIMSRGYLPCAIEFMDHQCLDLVRNELPFATSGQDAMLLMESDGPSSQVASDMEALGDICREMGAKHLLPAAGEKERARLWDVRRMVSLRIHDTAGLYIPEDVVVPLSRIADLVASLPALERKYGLKIFAFGHAGDGNIHLNITAEGKEFADRAEAGVVEVLRLVLAMGGTISGEHGVGLAKRPYLTMELSSASIRLQQGIKKIFDPNDILNPGKIFP